MTHDPQRHPPLNATLVGREDLTAELRVIRVRTDGPRFAFRPGQHAVLGLPACAPRAEGCAPESHPPREGELIRRAYSLASAPAEPEAEFYLKLVPDGALTPRLFALGGGDRLWLAERAQGRFTTEGVPPEKRLVLVATGTGLAPFMSMLRDGLCQRQAQVTLAHGARFPRDLGYRGELEALARRAPGFRYFPTVTRPAPEDAWSGFQGRVRALFDSDEVPADPESDHVFLCGLPEMVRELEDLFERRGFCRRASGRAGNLHCEMY